jgi:uncharacterized protein YeaO (DUF488 family)
MPGCTVKRGMPGYAEDMSPAPDARSRIAVRRIYDEPDRGAYRILVDRLWPRGFTKDRAAIDEWAKDAAPSAELRRWYQHDPERFREFARRYRKELSEPPASDAVAQIRKMAKRSPVDLVTATKDVEHSGAQVLFGVLTKGR